MRNLIASAAVVAVTAGIALLGMGTGTALADNDRACTARAAINLLSCDDVLDLSRTGNNNSTHNDTDND